MKTEKEIIMINEGVWRSVIKDGVSFGLIFGLLYFNHKVLAGSGIVDAIFIVMAFLFTYSKKSSSVKHFYSKIDAIRYLQGGRK